MKEYNITPTPITLTKVLVAYAKCGRGGQAVQDVMDTFHKSLLNGFMYTAVLEAYADADPNQSSSSSSSSSPSPSSVQNAVRCEELCTWMETQAQQFKPNARSYNAVIRTWGNSGVEIGALKAEQCLERMFRLWQEGVIEEGPNVYNYNAVMSAWANCGEEGNAERAEALLMRMERRDVKRNTISFNACIDAYAKNGNGEKAEMLLNRMEELYETKENLGCRPNKRSYNSVMNAYAKSLEKNAPTKAEMILRKMENMYEENEFEGDIKPDFVSFATVINAWARSFEYGKAEKVLQLYREMVDLYKQGNESLRPNGELVLSLLLPVGMIIT